MANKYHCLILIIGLCYGHISCAEVLHQGNYLKGGDYHHQQQQIIRSQADYKKILADYSEQPTIAIDFNQYQIVLIDMGQQTTGGHRIEIGEIEKIADEVHINIIFSQPDNNCFVTTALTNPYQFIKVKTTQNIIIHTTTAYHSCE